MRKTVAILICLLLSGCGKNSGAPAKQKEEITNEEETGIIFEKSYMEELSNEKKGWGMRRNLPNRPEFTEEQKSVMDKYGCIYMGSDEKKYLYLTFDEGYENGQTEKILDVLKEKGVTATFFVTGDYLKKEEKLIKRMVDEGHIVGNHTMNHPSMPKLESVEKMEEEILSLDRAFFDLYGKHMTYFRPPEGAYSEKSLAVAENLGYKSVFWSFAYDDWYRDRQRGKEYAYNKTMENLHSGCVLLLHAVSCDNANALGDIIDSARKSGYEFLSLDDYIG